MQKRPEIFAISIILFVPFAYAVSYIPDVCASPPAKGYLDSTRCYGDDEDQDKGRTCCWEENGVTWCQNCVDKGKGGYFCGPPVYMKSPMVEEGKLQEGNITGPELSNPLEERDIQEGNITTPDSDQKTGIFKDPTGDNNTFSQDDIGNLE